MELDRRGGRTEEADGSRREGTQRQPQNNELQERMTLRRSRLHGEDRVSRADRKGKPGGAVKELLSGLFQVGTRP